ncbi:MAG: hypothetical protein P1Q69_13420 [Candidatus Thorarchaeota archaeon]|nr:hypothetical protein [Candidatus Thorarchaeota archaeon]
MSSLRRDILEALTLSSIIAVIDISIGLLFFLLNNEISVFYTAANFMILEFGALLILGGCLMARQPLEDEKRYDDSGQPVTTWKYALIGKKLLITSLFVVLLGLLLGILSGFI